MEQILNVAVVVPSGFTVTSPLLPELVTEGESIDEVLVNVRDAFEAIRELYDDLGGKLPNGEFADES